MSSLTRDVDSSAVGVLEFEGMQDVLRGDDLTSLRIDR